MFYFHVLSVSYRRGSGQHNAKSHFAYPDTYMDHINESFIEFKNVANER